MILNIMEPEDLEACQWIRYYLALLQDESYNGALVEGETEMILIFIVQNLCKCIICICTLDFIYLLLNCLHYNHKNVYSLSFPI